MSKVETLTTQALHRIHLLIRRRRDPLQPTLARLRCATNDDEVRGLCRAAQVMRRQARGKGERQVWSQIEDEAIARLCTVAEQRDMEHETMLKKLAA